MKHKEVGVFKHNFALALQTHKKVVAISIFAVIFGAFGSTAVFAAIPDGSGVIHACRSNVLATIRIIDSATTSCNGTETLLKWSSVTMGQFVSNLVGADFSSATLSYRSMAGLDVHGGNFTNAVLNGADFNGANLSTTTIGTTNSPMLAKQANFNGVNFNGATFIGAIDFTGANLTGITLNNAQFASGGTMINGDFRSSNITNAQLLGYFEGANFANVDFRNTQTFNAAFTDSNLTAVRFDGMNLGVNTQFTNGQLTNAQFDNATISSVFRNATMTGADFTNASFVDADLQATNFSGATFTGATWSNVWCPDGTNSSAHSNTCIGHLVP